MGIVMSELGGRDLRRGVMLDSGPGPPQRDSCHLTGLAGSGPTEGGLISG